MVESDWAWAAEMAREQRARSERFKWLSTNFGTNGSIGYKLDLPVRHCFSFPFHFECCKILRVPTICNVQPCHGKLAHSSNALLLLVSI